MSVSRIKILRNLSKNYNSCNSIFSINSRKQIKSFGPQQQTRQSNHSRTLSTRGNNVLIKEPSSATLLISAESISKCNYFLYFRPMLLSKYFHIHAVFRFSSLYMNKFQPKMKGRSLQNLSPFSAKTQLTVPKKLLSIRPCGCGTIANAPSAIIRTLMLGYYS